MNSQASWFEYTDRSGGLKYNLTGYFPSWKVMNDWFGIFKEWFGYGWYKLKGWRFNIKWGWEK
ncbi:hypothetical protein [Bacteroides sedimenti]|uniref:MFS transporter n=1 Tax=Bacteroides sedimenti TaxID=2136147 RepID=A0ABM8I708_9BACE